MKTRQEIEDELNALNKDMTARAKSPAMLDTMIQTTQWVVLCEIACQIADLNHILRKSHERD